jgi:hypothetical protein
MAPKASTSVYKPRVLDREALDIADVLLEQGHLSAGTERYCGQLYLKFCSLNRLALRGDRSWLKFAAALLRNGKKASTAAVYISKAKAFLERVNRDDFGIAMRALRKLATRQTRRHARDLSIGQIRDVLVQVWSAGKRDEASILFFMWFSGLRLETVGRLLFGNIHLSPENGDLTVDVRVAKNATSPLHRKVLRVPGSWMPRVPRNMVKHLCSLLRNGQRRTSLCHQFPWLTTCERLKRPKRFRTPAQHVNMAIKRVWPKLNIPGRPATTYTFRRSALNFFIDQCRDQHGAPDWARVINYTLHRSVEQVRASYEKGLGEDED